MVEPMAVQVTRKVAEQLALIVQDGGASYYYTPEQVRRADFWSDLNYSEGADVLYEVRVDPETETEAATTRQRYRYRLVLIISGIVRDKRMFRNDPDSTDVDPSDIRFRLDADVARKLAEHTGWTFEARPSQLQPSLIALTRAEVEHQIKADGWVVVHLGWVAEFYDRAAA